MLKSFGKYEILEEIGAGGMAVVYKARDTLLDRLVALKVIGHKLEGGQRVRKRFLNEGKAAALLSHPNIVVVYELGLEDGFPFIAMEYLPGYDLSELIARRQPMRLQLKVGIALQIARALEHAHERGVIHRDIKPSNIRLVRGGGVKLMDFGIAKLPAEQHTRLTRTGALMGTPAYLSPEQLQGVEPTQASDVFAFGILLYELLACAKPFDGPHPHAVMFQIINTQPPPIPDQDLPPELWELVQGCLQKNPVARIHGFAAIVQQLSALRQRLRSAERTAETQRPAPGATPPAASQDQDELAEIVATPPEAAGPTAPRDSTQASTEQLVFPDMPAAARRPRAGRRSALLLPGTVLALLGGVLAAALLWHGPERPQVPAAATPRAGTPGAGPGVRLVPPTPPSSPASPPPTGEHALGVPQPQATTAATVPTAASPPSAGPDSAIVLPPPATPAAAALPTRSPTPARRASPTGRPSPRPASTPGSRPRTTEASPQADAAPPAATGVPTPAAAVRDVRLGAPEDTRICVDGRPWPASRAGAAWLLDSVPVGSHHLRLVHRERGVADRKLDVQPGTLPQVVRFEDVAWAAPRFLARLRLPGRSAVAGIESRESGAGGAWSRLANTPGADSSGLLQLEGAIDREYRIDLGSAGSVSVRFRPMQGDPDAGGELSVVYSTGTEAIRRCVPAAARGGACQPPPVLECVAID